VLGLSPTPGPEVLDEVARHVSTLLIADALGRAVSADRLTGLPTRGVLERALPAATARIAAGELLAVVVLDVDGLSRINAARGRSAGDQLLVTLAVAASQRVAPQGLACRFGSDEFVLLAPWSEQEARRQLEGLLAELRAFPAFTDGPGLSLSAGVACAPGHGRQAEELLVRADQALGAAKARGQGELTLWEPSLAEAPRGDRLAGIITGEPARDAQHVELLLETIRGVSGLAPLEDTLRAVVDRCVTVAGAERGLVLLEEEGGFRVAVAHDHEGRALEEPSFAASIASEALRCGGAVSRLTEGEDAISPSADAIGLQAVLCAPLVGDDVPRGVVYVDTSRQVAAYDEATIAFFEALTRELGTALRNATLYERLLAKAANLQARSEERERELVRIRRRLAQQPPPSLPGLVGDSSAMREVFRTLTSLEGTEVPVVVEGESGTGKELVSRAIHARSARAEGPWVAVNCAAIAPSLIESELFGHRQGAFTGAHADKTGLLEAASGGTVFLDEIGELPLESQAKLLRALQEGEIRRVGETTSRPIDVRVIAATNRDLKSMADQGTFREDLYYRLAVFRLRLPPLRERLEDVRAIAEHMLDAMREAGRGTGVLSQGALRALLKRRWPGNVRELRNALERAVVLAGGGDIEAEHVAAEDAPAGARALLDSDLLLLPLKEAKARFALIYAREAIKRAGGSVPAAAQLAGVTRQTLYRLIAE